MENPELDFVYALAVLPDGTGLAARESGLYRSDDEGQTWQSAYGTLRLKGPLSASAIAVSPDFAQDRTLFVGVSGGVLRSTDAGQSWSAIPLPDPPPQISTLTMSPAYGADGFILAGSFVHGVFYSTDRGTTWLRGNFSLRDYHVLTSAISPEFAADRTVLIGTETGVFNSRNGGRSWDVADLPYVAATSVAFAPDGIVQAGTDGDGLYTSADKGLTWTRAKLNSTLTISLILTPSVRERLVFADETLYRSLNAGTTWTPHKLRAPVTAAAPLSAHRLLIGSADGIIDSLDLPL